MAAAVAGTWAAPQEFFVDSDEVTTRYQTPVLQYQTPTPTYDQYNDQPAQYAFQWEVNDDYYGNYYGHQEERDGQLTKGR